jgi:hypothetical protein
MEQNKIVYFHIAKIDFDVDGLTFKTGQIVYIGSGSKSRLRSRTDRSISHLSVWDHLETKIVSEGLSTTEALILEQDYLEKYWKFGLLNKKQNVHRVKPVLYSEVNSMFYLNEQGNLLWKVDRMSGIRMKICAARKDTPAGNKGKNGYWCIKFNGNTFKLHRVVWVLANKQDLCTNLTIDHIDGDKSNNHPDNLRAVSQSTNNRNRKVKTSKLNIPRIRFSENQLLFHVQWTSLVGKKVHKYFTMKPLLKDGKSYQEAYDICFKNAVEFNNNLVIKG